MRVTKSLGEFQNFLRRAAVEPFAENRSHRASERLHLGPQRHPKMRFAFVIHLQVNPHCIGALLIFADILENESLARTRLLLLRVVRVGDERFAPLDLRATTRTG